MKTNHLIIRNNVARLAVLSVSICFIMISVPGCNPGESVPAEVETALTISSPVFQEGKEIPIIYTCDGEDISPPLAWDEPPAGTQSFALIVDDPDAPIGVFTHWVLFNIPPESRELREAFSGQDRQSGEALHGKNGFGEVRYGGPCPPPGSSHRYRFTLYALDQYLDLKPGTSKNQVIDAMQGHVLAQGRLTGTYKR